MEATCSNAEISPAGPGDHQAAHKMLLRAPKHMVHFTLSCRVALGVGVIDFFEVLKPIVGG